MSSIHAAQSDEAPLWENILATVLALLIYAIFIEAAKRYQLVRYFVLHDALDSPPLHNPWLPHSRYYTTIGLRKLNLNTWLSIDRDYKLFRETKEILLHTKLDEIVMYHKIALPAIRELEDLVREMLKDHAPSLFSGKLWNGEKFLGNLEEAMEDFSVLQKNPETEKWHLTATGTFFPAGWVAHDRLGMPLTGVHAPVPDWVKLSTPVYNFLDSIAQGAPAMERSTYFIQECQDLDELKRPDSLARLLFTQDPAAFYTGNPDAKLFVRHERQTFRLLPKSGAIAFGVRTYVTPMEELDRAGKERLLAAVEAWPDNVAKYKGRNGFVEKLRMMV